MGFFDFFKKKPEKEIMVVPSNPEQQRADEIADMARKRNKNAFPSKNGLQPGEIVLLSYAPKFMTNQTEFPGYWLYEYGLDDPKAVLAGLFEKGFIDLAPPKETLNLFKVAELKKICAEHGLKVSGRKAELISRISDALTDEEVEKLLPARSYVLTESGKKETDDNNYIFDIGREKYGFDFWEVNQGVGEKGFQYYRDYIWGELNKQTISAMNRYGYGPDYRLLGRIYKNMSDLVFDEKRYGSAMNCLPMQVLFEINFIDIDTRQIDIASEKIDKKAKVNNPYIAPSFKESFNVYPEKFLLIQQYLEKSFDDFEYDLIGYFTKMKLPRYLVHPAVLARLIISLMKKDNKTANEIYKMMEKEFKKIKNDYI